MFKLPALSEEEWQPAGLSTVGTGFSSNSFCSLSPDTNTFWGAEGDPPPKQSKTDAYVLIGNWVLCLDNLFILDGCCYPLQPIDRVEGLAPLLEQTSNFFQFTSNPSSNSVWSECVTKTSIALILQCEMHIMEHGETDGKECSSSVPKAF